LRIRQKIKLKRGAGSIPASGKLSIVKLNQELLNE